MTRQAALAIGDGLPALPERSEIRPTVYVHCERCGKLVAERAQECGWCGKRQWRRDGK